MSLSIREMEYGKLYIEYFTNMSLIDTTLYLILSSRGGLYYYLRITVRYYDYSKYLYVSCEPSISDSFKVFYEKLFLVDKNSSFKKKIPKEIWNKILEHIKKYSLNRYCMKHLALTYTEDLTIWVPLLRFIRKNQNAFKE